ncbi:hypothetical protein ACS0TY_015994 [Phlomoides rotata]
MNTTGGFLGSDNIGGFGYGIGISVGILLLITTITLASYYCTRSSTTNFVLPQRSPVPPPLPDYYPAEVGVDEATLTSYPKLLYSEAKVNHKDSTATCCSICLADYKSVDVLRVLPECGHLFHLKCVDPWLRLHPTCPVCRTSPMPTPLSTPLAEVVPLATRPMGYKPDLPHPKRETTLMTYLCSKTPEILPSNLPPHVKRGCEDAARSWTTYLEESVQDNARMAAIRASQAVVFTERVVDQALSVARKVETLTAEKKKALEENEANTLKLAVTPRGRECLQGPHRA